MAVGIVLAISGTAAAAPRDELQAVLDDVVADHPAVPGAVLELDAPGLRFDGAAGRTAHTALTPMTPATPFRLASTTKTFTAAAILRLHEDKRLDIDDPIAKYVPADLVDRINTYGGANHGHAITLRHLLQHTSGLGSHDNDLYTLMVGLQPNKRWTAREQVEFMIEHDEPVGPPGGQWSYSDTGFVLLGMTITRVTGKHLGAAFRELLPLSALGMRSTWHELFERVPPGVPDRAHNYFGPSDNYAWDPSFDSHGGGGLDATAGDLARFMRALFGHDVFKHRKTLELMLTSVPATGAKDGSARYGLGIGLDVIDGVDCWGHPGFWSSTMRYCPELDLAFAAATNQAEDGSGPLDGDGHTQMVIEDAVVPIVRAAGG